MSATSTTGKVLTVNHSLITIEGLTNVLPGSVVKIDDQILGLVTGFNDDFVDAMIFDAAPVNVGANVKLTANELEVPVSTGLLGRIIDPLGNPMDGLDLAKNIHTRPIDSDPLPLPDRAKISQQLMTGVGLVDLILPLGKGQRELIVGDQKAGKSTFLEQVAISQAKHDAVIIWAAIGQVAGDIKKLATQLHKTKIQHKTVVVASTAQDSASLTYLTPFTAMTIAEYFRDQGQDVVVILDDLTAHARCYREISLLAKRFPGRDSYPGDIFYVHARLLERAGSFINKNKPDNTVTITCLPVAETTESDLTSYIVSNLISITDGHILFDTEIFSQGNRPAINTGLSVTRVGKQTQSRLQRELNHELMAFLSEYSQTIKLTHFGAELTPTTQAILQKGQALISFLQQSPEITLPTEVILVGATMIWMGWWGNADRTKIFKYRANLLEKVKQPTTRAIFEKLLKEKDLVSLMASMQKQRTQIERLCQG